MRTKKILLGNCIIQTNLKYPSFTFLFMSKLVIGKVSEIVQGKLTRISAAGKDILVTRIDGKYYAMNNACNHAGADLHKGKLNGTELKCPLHGAKWDITTGNLISFHKNLRPEEIYSLIVEDDTLLIEI
jgi:nitrite reductase/ring-hydroxylating ferredoxin subunit